MNRLNAFARIFRVVLPGGVVLAATVAGCKGPERDARVVPLDIPDQAPIVVQIGDGPRTENAERELEKQAQRMAQQLFRAEPMAREVASGPTSAAPVEGAEPVAVVPLAEARPAWADGVEQPADAGENDLPQGWPVEVRRGETPALLAQWAGLDAQEILFTNAETLGNRKWLKVGDRITVTMSANRKVAFDRLRDAFQKERVDAFFANKYFEKVIVYRVKKGEFIATAAKRYGDVPLWLIEEFNQMDFRGLQPGDEILIPVVGELPAGMRQPPPLRVVDEEGHPLAEGRQTALESRIRGDFMAKARMALDDSNVFMRGGPMVAAAPSQVPGGLPPVVAGAQAYPRPEQVLPSASIGLAGQAQPQANHPLLPDYGGQPGALSAAYVPPAPVELGVAPVAAAGGVAVAPAAPGGARPASPRDVVVKRGESLLHYVKWAKSSLDGIKAANPHLDPERIFVGARISIPMSDDQYVEFVKARAAWEKEKAEAAEAEAGKPDKASKGDKSDKSDKAKAQAKKHTVKSGETATSIARAHRVSVKDLKAANPGVSLKKLKVGTKLTLPAKAR